MAPRRHPIAAALFLALNGGAVFAGGPTPNVIVPDGRTMTGVQVKGATTNVTTSTVQGGNAFNSFTHFKVGQGNTVDLQIPSAAANLVNLVHGSRTVIDGILNAYQNGQIGGRVFFADPHGFVVGASGVVNVGSLSVSTPTKAFLDQLISPAGVIDAQSVQRLMNGDVPLSPSGLIAIDGKVNATDSVSLRGWDVSTSGAVATGPAAALQIAAFAGTVNSEGLQQGAEIVARSGVIEIVAAGDAALSGTLAADGASGQRAGKISVHAAGDIAVGSTAVVSAKGVGADSAGGDIRVYAEGNTSVARGARFVAAAGDSGDGGAIEVSAAHRLTLSGGAFDASASNGRAGSILLDPNELVVETDMLRSAANAGSDGISWNAGSLTLSADNSITINPDIVISTRQVAVRTDQTARHAHINNVSTGDSGDLTLTAKKIVVGTGAQLLAHGDGKAGGDIHLTATDNASQIFLKSLDNQDAGIDLHGATLKGKDIFLSASADDAYKYTGSEVANTILKQIDNLAYMVDVSISQARAHVTLDQKTSIVASGSVDIRATANADAEMRVLSPNGFAVGYGKATASATATLAEASIKAQGAVTVATEASGRTNVSVNAINRGRTNSLLANSSKYIDLALAISDGDLTSQAVIGASSSINAGGALSVQALGNKTASSTATGGAYDDGTAGAALTFSSFTSNVLAAIDGKVTNASDITVAAKLATPGVGNTAVASSGSGSGIISGVSKFLSPNDVLSSAVSVAQSALLSAAGKEKAASPTLSQKFGLAASFLHLDQQNIVEARVGPAAQISATGKLEVTAESTDLLTYRANASVDQAVLDGGKPETKDIALSAAIAVVNLENLTTASIGAGAVVDAKNSILVRAHSDIPVPYKQWGDWSDVHDFSSGLTKVTDLLSSGTFDILTGFTQSFAQSKKLGLAGSFSFFSLDNEASASIGDGARINTAGTAATGQDVTVQALASQGTVNLDGVFGFKFFGGDAGKAGIGGAMLDLNFTDSAQARIGRGAIVNADKLAVTSNSDTNNISIAEAGGKSSEGTAFNATLSLIDIHNTTLAQIDRGAVISAKGDVDVRATDSTLNLNVAGGISKGTSAVGFAVGVTNITRNTVAGVGNPGSPADSVILALDGLSADAQGSFTLPGANPFVTGQAVLYRSGTGGAVDGALTEGKLYYVIVPDPKTPNVIRLADSSGNALGRQPLTALFNAAPGGSLASTGAAAAGGHVAVAATNRGSLTSVAIAGSLASDKPEPDPKNSKDVSEHEEKVAAADKANKARYGVALSGDASVNSIHDLTQAGVEGARITQASLFDISAANSSSILSVAGAIAVSTSKGKVPGIAGSYSENDTENRTRAYVTSSAVDIGGAMNVSADTTGNSIQAFTAGVAVSTNHTAVAGSVSVNNTANETAAWIDGQSQIRAASEAISAKDATAILAVAGSAEVSGKNGIGVGAAFAFNDIENTTDAHIAQSDVEATAGGLSVTQRAEHEIKSAAVSVGGGSGGLALNFSIAANFIKGTDTAYVLGKKSTGLKASGDITLSASESSSILAVGGGLSISGGTGIGGSGSYSQIDNDISAYLKNTAAESTGGNVTVASSSSGSITTIGIGFAGGKQVGIAGSVAINRIDTVTDAYISGSDVQADGSTAVSADANDSLAIYAGALGIGLNGVGIGGTVGVNQLYGRTSAHISDASKVDAKGNKSADVPLLDDIGPGTQAARGVAVAARTLEKADTWAISGGVSDGFGIGLTGSGNDVRTQTLAYVDGAAELNQRNQAGANAGQGVSVGAFGSIALSSQLGGIGIGLESAGVGATVGIGIVKGTTKAYVDNASVDAAGSVQVGTFTTETVDAIGIAAAAGGEVGLAGTVFSTKIDSTNEAFVRGTDTMNAGGNLSVTAQDHVYLGRSGGGHAGMRAGAAAVSGGAAAGAAVSVVSISNSTSAHITDAQTNAKGTTQVQAIASQEVDNLVMGIVIGQWLGAGASVVVNDIATRTSAFIDETASGLTKINANAAYIDAAQDVTVSARSTTDVDTRIGAVAGGFVGIGASVEVTSIRNDVSARLGAGVQADAKRNVLVEASSEQNAGSLVVAFGGGAIGVQGAVSLVTVGGLISATDAANTRGTADEQSSLGLTMMGAPGSPDELSVAGAFLAPLAFNSTTASIGDRAHVSAGGSLSVHASDKSHVALRAGAGVAGVAGLGASIGIATLQQRVFAYADHDAELSAGGTLGIAAEASVADSNVNSFVAAAGGVAVVAAVSKLDSDSTVQAYLAQSSTVKKATAVRISATRSNAQQTNAFGAAISSSAALGASIAESSAKGTTTAYVGDGADLAKAGALSVSASNTVPEGSHSAGARAIAGAGGALVGINATVADASSTGDVVARTGSRVKLPDGDVSITASKATDQRADTFGIAAGYVAIGVDVSTASSSGSTEATLGDGATTSASRTGALSVTATAEDFNKATAVAGSGGVVAGNGSEARTSDTSSVRAGIAGAATVNTLYAGAVLVNAENTTRYQASADSVNAAFVGASGAVARNDATSSTAAEIGDNVTVVATSRIAMGARNSFISTPDSDSASGAAGGVLVGSAAVSSTAIHGDSSVTLGDSVRLGSGTDPITNPGGITLIASSVLSARDQVKLSSGGLIAGAGTDSRIDATLTNSVDVGQHDQLASFGGIGAGTFTQAAANSISLVNTYGVAGIGVAKSFTSITASENVRVADDVDMTAFGNIDLTAGQDPTGFWFSQLSGSSSAQSYVRALIAIPAAYATTRLQNDASLTIGANTGIGSAQNVTIGAYRGSPSATADGTGHGFQLGFIPTNGSNSGDGVSSTGTSTVTHNGTVTAGIYHELNITIPDCGSSGVFCSTVNALPGGAPFAYGFNPAFDTTGFVNGNFSGTTAELLKSGVSSAPVGAVTLGTLFASGGTVSVNADTLHGNGRITSYGGPTITVTNNSPDYLLLGPVFIPNAPGGDVFFTGAAKASQAGAISVAKIGTDAGSSASIHNSHKGSVGNSDLGPALFLTGDLQNLGGSIQIVNDFGSLGAAAAIFGKEVNIRVPEGVGVFQLPEPKPFYAGGNPYSEWATFMTWPGGNPAQVVPDANTAFNRFFFTADPRRGRTGNFLDQSLPPELFLPARPLFFANANCTGFFCNVGTLERRGVLTSVGAYNNADFSGSQRSSQVYGSRVAIIAKYIDINGGITVGQPTNWSVSLAESMVAPVVLGQVLDRVDIQWNGWSPTFVPRYRTDAIAGGELAVDAWRFQNNLASSPIFNIVTSATGRFGDSLIGARYDAQANRITLDDVRASSGGGTVSLNGGIISTNTLGRIHVNGGLGDVQVDNRTGIPLVVQNIYAGGAGTLRDLISTVDITDTLQPLYNNNPVNHWLYRYTPGTGVSVFNGLAGSSLEAGTMSAAAASGSYQPVSGLRWQWQEQATIRQSLPLSYLVGDSLERTGNVLGCCHWSWVDPDGFGTNNPWRYITPTGTLSTTPQGQLATGQAGLPVFQQSLSAAVTKVAGFQSNIDSGDSQNMFLKGIFDVNASNRQGDFLYPTEARLNMLTSVKADNPIAIDFSGNGAGRVALSSNAAVSLTGNITNPTGTTTLGAGGSLTENLHAIVVTKDLALAATAGIGTRAQAFSARLGDNGTLSATAGEDGLFLNLDSGAQLRTVSSKNAAGSRFGDVVITAANDLLAYSDASVVGSNISLTSVLDGVGTSLAALPVSAVGSSGGPGGAGVVNVTALRDINLVDGAHHNFLAGDIVSLGGGNVSIAVPNGTILNARGQTAAQALSPEQIRAGWRDLRLTKQLGAEQGTATDRSVVNYENMVNRSYQEFWQLRNNGSVQGTTFRLNAAAVPLYRPAAAAALNIASPSDEQVQAYAAGRFEAANTVVQANLDPNAASVFDSQFSYHATAAQITALTKNAVWTENELSHAVAEAALLPTPGTPVGLGKANIVAADVKLTTGGAIGKLAAPVNISRAQMESGNLSDEQAAALVLATAPGDVVAVGVDAQGRTVTFTLGSEPAGVTLSGFQIAQTAPLFVDASGKFTANAGGAVFLQSVANVLKLDRVQAKGSVGLVAPDSIRSAGTSPTQINTTGDLSLVAGSGSLGAADAPLVYEIGGTLISANAARDAYLTVPHGDLAFDRVVVGGIASLEAGEGGILPKGDGVAIRAQDIRLSARDNIGAQDLPLNVLVEHGGSLTGTSASGAAWVRGSGESLQLGSFSASTGMTISADLALGTNSGAQITSGASLDVQAASLRMGAGSGMSAQGPVRIATTKGDMILGKVQSGLGDGKAVELTSLGMIAGDGDGQTNVVADQPGARTFISAGTGIGTASSALEIKLPWLQASTVHGSVYIHDLADLYLQALSVTDGAAGVSSDGALRFETVSASGNVKLRAGESLTGRTVISGADTTLIAGADMTLDTVDAGGNVSLDLGGTLTMKSLGGSTASLSAAKDLNIGNAKVKYGLDLAASNMDVKLSQLPGFPPLQMNVTGYKGGVSGKVALNVDAPAGIDFGQLRAKQIDLITTADGVSIASGYVPGRLSMLTPSVNLLMNNQDTTPQPVNVQLYQPSYAFKLLQNGRSSFTDAYVLYFGDGFTPGVSNYTAPHTDVQLSVLGISVIDDSTRKAQYQPPLVLPFAPGAASIAWSVPSYPLAPGPGGAVNLSGAAPDVPQ